ncbi:MAG: hypothetical protein JSV96_14485 [Candidatus Aminicenantes bacterium]|nr:MAG: hypothetical protein JSV96_14485 [Candidatus Aminicenantes bacterium]
MELWIGALNLGFLYAFMAMGVLITFRIHSFPDITVDGSFTAGAATTAVLIVSGVNPFIAVIASFVVGLIAGSLTALIHTRFKINGLLAGILVMTGLYSINLHIMGRSNIPLLNRPSFIAFLDKFNPGIAQEIWICICLFIVMLLFWIIVSLFFRTDFGIRMRATGNNPIMASATGVNVNRMTVFGVALANGLVGTSGSLIAQYQGFADIGMGIGTVVIGLASVIIGESILRSRSIYVKICSAIVGSVIFRFMIAFALYVGMNPLDLKLLTAIFVLVTLVISKTVTGKEKRKVRLPAWMTYINQRKKMFTSSCVVVIIIFAVIFGYRKITSGKADSSIEYKIGFLQVSDHALLNVTRDSFLEEMERIGYKQGKNCAFYLENANGELPIVNMILDKFLFENVDIVVPISTACTQATINKIKDRPVVFATVANPFIIGAGKSEKEHLPNVTGVYGWVPMDETMMVVRQILPGRLKVGAIWDTAHANSVFNVSNLQKAVDTYDDVTFEGATITNSSEVYQAAVSLVAKGIDAFVLSPDNIVYSAFESVVKAAKPKKIPIFLSDVERLEDGALGAYGYDYTVSGIQAAHLVDRVLKGENPGAIPFERYKKITFGLNLEVANEIGIKIPSDLLSRATRVHGIKGEEVSKRSTSPKSSRKKKKLALFVFSDHMVMQTEIEAATNELKKSGILEKYNIEIDIKNSQNDFGIAQAIAQDIVRQNYDFIITFSTPALQVTANANKKIPHVFGAVSDPFRMGVANDTHDHQANVTGVATMQPVEFTVKAIRDIFPNARKIGIVWNPAEACSEACTYEARDAAKRYNFELLEATVSSSGEVLDAARSLINRGIEVLFTSGDNTVEMAIETLADIMKKQKIPYFTNNPPHVEIGTLFSVGADYYQVGVETAKMAQIVINGKNPKDIPIRKFSPEQIYVNLDLAKAYKIDIPKPYLERAVKVMLNKKLVDTNQGTLSSKKDTSALRIALFLFNDQYTINLVAKGVMDELESSGILKKQNITVDRKNAQNEFFMAQSVAQDIVRQKYDFIISLSTPALQVTANANKKIPHVFGFVTDPYRMGVARTTHDHLPHLTGVATLQPVEKTIEVMRELFPKAKKIGIVWNPAEACSEACTYKAREAAKQYNFELLEANVSSTSEVLDALNTLISKDIDLFITSGDNTVNMALETIAKKLKQFKIPYFTNVPLDVEKGSFVSIGADYYEVGKETARMAVRVINGEDPKDIPIKNYAPEKMTINLSLAKLYGIDVPERILNKASKVMR